VRRRLLSARAPLRWVSPLGAPVTRSAACAQAAPCTARSDAACAGAQGLLLRDLQRAGVRPATLDAAAAGGALGRRTRLPRARPGHARVYLHGGHPAGVRAGAEQALRGLRGAAHVIDPVRIYVHIYMTVAATRALMTRRADTCKRSSVLGSLLIVRHGMGAVPGLMR